jgi:S1-C subfamily serine protease
MDRIVSVNGTDILTTEELDTITEQYHVGDVISLTIERGGETFTYQLTLQEYVPNHIKNKTK